MTQLTDSARFSNLVRSLPRYSSCTVPFPVELRQMTNVAGMHQCRWEIEPTSLCGPVSVSVCTCMCVCVFAARHEAARLVPTRHTALLRCFFFGLFLYYLMYSSTPAYYHWSLLVWPILIATPLLSLPHRPFETLWPTGHRVMIASLRRSDLSHPVGRLSIVDSTFYLPILLSPCEDCTVLYCTITYNIPT